MTDLPDLVVRLQATLDEVERAARAVSPLGYTVDMGGSRQGEVFTHGRIRYASEDGMPRSVAGNEPQHFRNWEPDAVLRLVQSHRDLVAEWQKQATIRDVLADDPEVSDDAYLTAVGIVAGLWAAVTLVARGYGLEDEEGGNE